MNDEWLLSICAFPQVEIPKGSLPNLVHDSIEWGAAMSGWIGVDLDGTLARYDGWRGSDHIGTPVPAMLNRVRQWLAEGKEVRVFTARACVPEQIPPVRAWLDALGLERVGITNIKDANMSALWDDRAVQVVMNRGEAVGPIGDADNGWLTPPARYMTQGRETIDRIRSLAHLVTRSRDEGDRVFAFFCLATALKLEDRAHSPTDLDGSKWYKAMAQHALDPTCPDPRSGRLEGSTWTPWSFEALPEGTVSESMWDCAEGVLTAMCKATKATP